MSIRAISWIDATHAGYQCDADWSKRCTSAVSDWNEAMVSVGGNTRFLNQLNHEAKVCLHAACLALEAMGWFINDGKGRPVDDEVGLVVMGYQGWIKAEHRFFDDYVQHGRASGRGSLFVYTLPTSVMAQVSLALRLDGPLLHFTNQEGTIEALLRQARMLVDVHESDCVLAMCSDEESCVCWVIDRQMTQEAYPCRDQWKLNMTPTELVAVLSVSQAMECIDP